MAEQCVSSRFTSKESSSLTSSEDSILVFKGGRLLEKERLIGTEPLFLFERIHLILLKYYFIEKQMIL